MDIIRIVLIVAAIVLFGILAQHYGMALPTGKLD